MITLTDSEAKIVMQALAIITQKIEDKPTPKKKAVKKFMVPTLAEIAQYCSERQNRIDPSAFFDFYQSKDWKVGNQRMKDWKAAVRTWERRDGRGNNGASYNEGCI